MQHTDIPNFTIGGVIYLKSTVFTFIKAMECLFNKLTFFNFKIYYKEKNYLKVKTVLFKYITSSIVKFGILVYYIN